jgi:flagellar basal body-associated protein FliL
MIRMFSRKRLALLASIIGIAAVVSGVIIYFCFFYGKESEFFTSSHIRFFAYSNDDADTKINASSKTLVEFSSSDYAKVASNETVNTEYVVMRADQDDWDGMHFIFDLSGYNLNAIASIRFTWIGRIIGPESCDCMELWYYKDSSWVKFDDINQSIWMTKTEEWTSNLADYIDANGKVHISVLIHVKNLAQPIDQLSAYLLTQFVNLEVSYIP